MYDLCGVWDRDQNDAKMLLKIDGISLSYFLGSRQDFYGILEIPHHKNNLSSRQDCH